jgi:hypothetical protein
MTLVVKLFATFRAGRFDVAQREYPPGTSVGDVVDGLGIRRQEIGVLLLSGRHTDLEARPSQGETLSIFPLVGGG